MDPQVKSILTTIAGYAAAGVATWAVSHGIIPGSEAGDFSNMLVTVGFGVIAALIAEYKRRQVSQKAMIEQVNKADNGVKVVASASTSAPVVNEPVKVAK